MHWCTVLKNDYKLPFILYGPPVQKRRCRQSVARVHLKLGAFCLIWNLSIFTAKSRSGLTQFKIPWWISNRSYDMILPYKNKITIDYEISNIGFNFNQNLTKETWIVSLRYFAVKMERFQIKPKVLNLKCTLVYMVCTQNGP